MKFSTRDEIEAPADRVWAALTNAEMFEQAARSRGAEVIRHPEPQNFGVGTSWTTHFEFRGVRRKLFTEVVSCDAPGLLVFESNVGGVDVLARFELEPLGNARTRMGTSLDMTARSIPGRILIQTLKLGKTTLNQKFRRRMRRFARYLGRT
ncbi:SRPBCC family protein [Tropicimonas marinistellae]|uniref:SRPBCC family protein n=1 Tax=Tropicimonas marinistellae TaxID=1739787 RepID=UPI000832E4DA|nr:SRPBCC family protein [Tropicimonas marinistellae]